MTQLRSGYCKLLGFYKSRIKKDASPNLCADCVKTPHDVNHLFACPAHPTTLIPSDLWSKPRGSNDTCLHLVEPPRVRSFIWQMESTHPSRTVVKSIEVFMKSSQSCVAMLTHYSTEPLTTRPDYDPLLLLLALAGDVHPNPGPPD